VRTFTIGFPSYGKFDEIEHARLISRHFDTHHTELMAEPATANLLPQLAHQFDEPVVDSSMIPTFLLSQLVGQSCTVALGGDGGDELFGGYGHHSRLLKMQELSGWMPWSVRRVISKLATNYMPLGFAGGNIRTWIQALDEDLGSGLPLIASYFDANTRQQLMAKYVGWKLVAETIHRESVPPNSDLLQRATRWDFSNYLAEDILVKVDRASMLNSLEVRSPLLDQHLIEFAFGKVPSCLKATANNKKILLKRLAAKILPPEFDLQRKQGFSIPLAAWLKSGPFLDLFQEVLLDSGSMFEQDTINTLLIGQQRGCGNEQRLFALVLFELWRQEYSVTL
jgi:asparagine synthase (glutamine-hydrolysing)